MSGTLDYANNKQTYTLVDRGTWLYRFADLGNLVTLVEGDPLFYNPYGVILVNPNKNSQNNIQKRFEAATEFVRWLIKPHGQNLIGNYTINGEKLFHPSFKENIGNMSSNELLFWGITVNSTKS